MGLILEAMVVKLEEDWGEMVHSIYCWRLWSGMGCLKGEEYGRGKCGGVRGVVEEVIHDGYSVLQRLVGLDG